MRAGGWVLIGLLLVNCAVDGSDMLNGEYIREHLVEPTVRVESVDDPAFVNMVTGA